MSIFFRTTLLLVSLLYLTTGCASLVQEPNVTVLRTTLTGIDTAGADLEFYLGVNNPNAYDVTLLAYTYDLKVMTLPLAHGGAQQTVSFSSGKQTDMRLPVRLKYSDLLEILKRRPDPDKITCHILARLQIDSPLGEMTIPIDEHATFSIPEKYRPSYLLDRVRDSLKSLY